ISVLSFDSTGNIFAWSVFAFSIPFGIQVTGNAAVLNDPRVGIGDFFSTLVSSDNPNTPAFGCTYSNTTPGVWTGSLAGASDKNIGGDCTCPNMQPLASASPLPTFGEGNPINPGTGNKFQAETDFTAAPHTGLSLR